MISTTILSFLYLQVDHGSEKSDNSSIDFNYADNNSIDSDYADDDNSDPQKESTDGTLFNMYK